MSKLVDKVLFVFSFLFSFFRQASFFIYQLTAFSYFGGYLSEGEPDIINSKYVGKPVEIEGASERPAKIKRPKTLDFVPKLENNFKNKTATAPKKAGGSKAKVAKNKVDSLSISQKFEEEFGSPAPKKVENQVTGTESIAVDDQVIHLNVQEHLEDQHHTEPQEEPKTETMQATSDDSASEVESPSQNVFTPSFNFYPPSVMNNKKFLARRNSKRFVIGDGEDELPSPNPPDVTITESPNLERKSWANQANAAKLLVPSKGLK